jgi:hypothetical protein
MHIVALLSPPVSTIFNNWQIPSQPPPRRLGWRSVSRERGGMFQSARRSIQPVYLRSRLTTISWTVLNPSHVLKGPWQSKYLPKMKLQRKVSPTVDCGSELGVRGCWAKRQRIQYTKLLFWSRCCMIQILDTLSKARQAPRPMSPVLSATHHIYQMVQQSMKRYSATKSKDARHWYFVNTSPVEMVRTSGTHAWW